MAQNLHNSERLPAVIIVLQFVGHSPGRYLIYQDFSTLLLSHRSLFFTFGHVVSFSGVGSRIFLSMVAFQQSVVIFSGLVGRAEGTYFYSIILNQFGALFLQQMIFGIGSIPSFWYVIQECMSLTIGFCLSKTIYTYVLEKLPHQIIFTILFFPESLNATNIY